MRGLSTTQEGQEDAEMKLQRKRLNVRRCETDEPQNPANRRYRVRVQTRCRGRRGLSSAAVNRQNKHVDLLLAQFLNTCVALMSSPHVD